MDNLSICCMDNVFPSITYRELFHMFYGPKMYIHTTYSQIVHMLHGQNVFFHTTYGKFVSMLCVQKLYLHTTCRKIVQIWYGKTFLSIPHMDKLSIYCKDKLSIYVIYTKMCQMIQNRFIMNI